MQRLTTIKGMTMTMDALTMMIATFKGMMMRAVAVRVGRIRSNLLLAYPTLALRHGARSSQKECTAHEAAGPDNTRRTKQPELWNVSG